MFNKRKAIVSLNTFALLLILYLAIFFTSYIFFTNSKLNSEIKFKEKENLNSALSFRSEVINLLKYPNSSFTYINSYESDNINITINGYVISSSQIVAEKLSTINISTLGINFCLNYSFIESQDIVLFYNGSCVALN